MDRRLWRMANHIHDKLNTTPDLYRDLKALEAHQKAYSKMLSAFRKRMLTIRMRKSAAQSSAALRVALEELGAQAREFRAQIGSTSHVFSLTLTTPEIYSDLTRIQEEFGLEVKLREKALYVTTDDIHLTHDGWSADVGRLVIKIWTTPEHSRIFTRVQPDGEARCGNYCHPQVSAEGNLCLGTLGDMFPGLLVSGQLYMIVSGMWNILHDYNPNDSFIYLPDFGELDPWECNHCADTVDEYSPHWCCICSTQNCRGCTVTCGGCRNRFCGGCADEHLSKCNHCKRDGLCSECLDVDCTRCNGIGCVKCTRYNDMDRLVHRLGHGPCHAPRREFQPSDYVPYGSVSLVEGDA